MAVKDINNEEKWESFCRRLLELTREGTVEWRDWSSNFSRPDACSPLYVSEYNSYLILIYKSATKYWIDEDRYEWHHDVGMELINYDGLTKWEFPRVPSRFKLLDQIQFKVGNVQGLLDDILDD